MFLGTFDELAWQIIDLLIENGELKVNQIDENLVSRFGIASSQSTVYRRIADLRKMQVLLVFKRKVSINPIWVEHIQKFLARFDTRAQHSSGIKSMLPKREGEKRVFNAHSLFEIDPVWNSILLEIGSMQDEKVLKGYNARSWHALTMPESENALYHSLSQRNVQTEIFFDGSSPLIDYSENQLQKNGLTIKKVNLTNEPENLFVWVGKNYSVECVLPNYFSTELLNSFDELSEPRAQKLEELSGLFEKKVNCKLIVTKSLRRAENLKATYCLN